MRVSVPEEALSDAQDRSTRSLMRELLDIVCPQIHFASLRPTTNIQKVEELLLKIGNFLLDFWQFFIDKYLDEQPIYTRYKVGVLYCGDNQSTEEQVIFIYFLQIIKFIRCIIMKILLHILKNFLIFLALE